MATIRLDTTHATTAVDDLRDTLARLRAALYPPEAELRKRHEAVTRELQAHAPKTATVAALEVAAQDMVARERWPIVDTGFAAAERALDAAARAVTRNQAALDAVPDFLPPRGSEPGAEYETRALRLELTLRDVRSELRELSLDALLDAHAESHTGQDWLVATAAEAELRRLLRPGATKVLGGDTDAVLRNKARVQHALDTARQARRKLVDTKSEETVARHATLLREYEAELRHLALLVHELRARGRVPASFATASR